MSNELTDQEVICAWMEGLRPSCPDVVGGRSLQGWWIFVAEWRDEQGRRNTKWLAVYSATEDAQVMAAAPDLFEALVDALGHLRLPGEGPLKGVEACAEKARAALTKARGGAR